MLNINIIKDKSELYFKNNLKEYCKDSKYEEEKQKFYHFVSSLCQKVISNDSSDFSKEEQDIINRYNLDVTDILNYFKVDIKNFYVESGKTNT